MTKVAIHLLLPLILLSVFSRQTTEPIRTERINGVLCKNDSSWLPSTYPDAKPWVPTKEQVEATESVLEAYLKATPHSEFVAWKKADRLKFWERLAQYKRQYYGFTRKGKELIYGNFYCDETPLSCNPRDVLDGGDCYLRVIFDVQAKKVMLFLRNGKA